MPHAGQYLYDARLQWVHSATSEKKKKTLNKETSTKKDQNSDIFFSSLSYGPGRYGFNSQWPKAIEFPVSLASDWLESSSRHWFALRWPRRGRYKIQWGAVTWPWPHASAGWRTRGRGAIKRWAPQGASTGHLGSLVIMQALTSRRYDYSLESDIGRSHSTEVFIRSLFSQHTDNPPNEVLHKRSGIKWCFLLIPTIGLWLGWFRDFRKHLWLPNILKSWLKIHLLQIDWIF